MTTCKFMHLMPSQKLSAPLNKNEHGDKHANHYKFTIALLLSLLEHDTGKVEFWD